MLPGAASTPRKAWAWRPVTSPRIGYGRASLIAREAEKRGLTIREILEKKGDFSPAEIQEILNLEKLGEPVAPGRKRRNRP